MSTDESVQKLDFSDEFLLDSVERRLDAGEYYSALTLLNKRNGMYEPSADAFALAADIYEGMGLYPLAADAWFRFLDTCNEADFSEGYEGLAVAFMNMGNELQSAFYYHRVYAEDEEAFASLFEDAPKPPPIRIVHSEGEEEPETLANGLALLKSGELEEAKSVLLSISEKSPDYPSAAGIAAMCTLLLGDEEGAERECEALLKNYPENVQALTTYCAVLGARGETERAQETARRLADIKTDSTEDLYRVATALCETRLDDAAYGKLELLKEKLPYDNNVLYFHAVAAYHLGKLPEAIDSLERLTTVYPRKAVASYYLVRMRELADGNGKSFPMSYYYRIPEDEYRMIANFFIAANNADESNALRIADLPELEEFFRLAFDEMEGRDEKMQMLAVKVAVKTRSDGFLREVLLDCEGDEIVKLSILHELTMRNEDDSFGTVICNLYKEFFTHKIDIGKRKREEFMRAFADVYSKFALIGEENEEKICVAAEDVYRALSDAQVWNYFDERAALAAAIYREARMHKAERSIDEIADLFEANKYTTEEILNFMM